MKLAQRVDEDRCVLLNYIFPDLVAVYVLLPKYPFRSCFEPPHFFAGDDGLGFEFKRFYEGNGHPISMAFVLSSQLALDILYIRRAAGINDVHYMRDLARRICRERQQFLTQNDLPMLHNMINFIPALEGQNELIKTQLGTDLLQQYKASKGWGEMNSTAIEKDTLWNMNPWLCANASAYAVNDWWSYGADLCSGAGSIQSTMHLWNMLKQTGHLASFNVNDSNLLFEHLINVFGRNVFQGAPPKSNFAFRFMAMLGQATAAAASQTRGAPVRHATGSGITPGMSALFRLHTSVNGLQDEQVAQIHRKTSNSNATQISTENGAAWDDLLQPLLLTQSLVEAELGMVSINFYKIQLLCTTFLRKLWDVIKYDLAASEKIRPGAPVEDETQLPFITGWVMKAEGNLEVLRKASMVVQEVLVGAQTNDYLLQF
jgi:hypothetical protein